MSGRRGCQTARLDFKQNTKKKKQHNRQCSYRQLFVQHTPVGRILIGTVLLLNRIYKPYAFETFAQQAFQWEIANKIGCQIQQTMILVHNVASPIAMGPPMVPLALFLIHFLGRIAPAKRCAVISSMSGRRGVQTALLDLSKNQKKTK